VLETYPADPFSSWS